MSVPDNDLIVRLTMIRTFSTLIWSVPCSDFKQPTMILGVPRNDFKCLSSLLMKFQINDNKIEYLYTVPDNQSPPLLLWPTARGKFPVFVGSSLVLGLNGGHIIRGRIIPSNTVSYDEQVKMPV